MTIGGSWGAYYWNGMIYSSELDRGFDIMELTPSAQLSANEIAAAKLVKMTQYNPQSQPSTKAKPERARRTSPRANARTPRTAQRMDTQPVVAALPRARKHILGDVGPAQPRWANCEPATTKATQYHACWRPARWLTSTE